MYTYECILYGILESMWNIFVKKWKLIILTLVKEVKPITLFYEHYRSSLSFNTFSKFEVTPLQYFNGYLLFFPYLVWSTDNTHFMSLFSLKAKLNEKMWTFSYIFHIKKNTCIYIGYIFWDRPYLLQSRMLHTRYDFCYINIPGIP